MTSTRHDELVEEIGDIVCPGCVLFSPHEQKCRHIYWASLKEAQKKCTTLSKIPAPILKAVVDGMPLPGEVGRYSERAEGETGAMWQMDMYLLGNARQFIALSPTGREEE